MLSKAEDSVLVVVDMQDAFLESIQRKDEVIQRVEFLTKAARLMDIPIICTEQNPARLGKTLPAISQNATAVIPKMSFSCAQCPEFTEELERHDRDSTVVCGVETHICVLQTALDVIEGLSDVEVASDACAARTDSAHQSGIDRMRDEELVIIHTESLLYQWLGTAEHSLFRDALKLVKAYPPA
jgi:nicotinamidase-related amidase